MSGGGRTSPRRTTPASKRWPKTPASRSLTSIRTLRIKRSSSSTNPILPKRGIGSWPDLFLTRSDRSSRCYVLDRRPAREQHSAAGAPRLSTKADTATELHHEEETHSQGASTSPCRYAG